MLRTVLTWLGRLLLLAVLFVVTCSGGVVFLTGFHEKRATLEIEGDPPGHFPVIVITRDSIPPTVEANPLHFEDLGAFLAEHPGAGFLIPSEVSEALNNQLREASSSRSSAPDALPLSAPWLAEFRVLENDEGRQLIEARLSMDDDDVNRGVYVAREGSMEARTHLSYFGPGFMIGVFLESILLAAGITLVAFVAWLVRHRRKKSLASPT